MSASQDPNLIRKDFMKVLIKSFFPKNLHKIYINFLQKIFNQFLPKVFLRSSENLLEFFERSSIKIFLRSSEDLLVFVLIFNYEIFFLNVVKWSLMVRRSSEDRLIKSSGKLLTNSQKIFLRSHEDLRKIFIEDFLKI